MGVVTPELRLPSTAVGLTDTRNVPRTVALRTDHFGIVHASPLRVAEIVETVQHPAVTVAVRTPDPPDGLHRRLRHSRTNRRVRPRVLPADLVLDSALGVALLTQQTHVARAVDEAQRVLDHLAAALGALTDDSIPGFGAVSLFVVGTLEVGFLSHSLD